MTQQRRAQRLELYLALVGMIVVTVGCAGGNEFARPSHDSLALGKTTEADVQQRMGEPSRRGTAVRNGETVSTLSYGHALAVPYVDDVKTGVMGFYFLKGVLVGYEFTSAPPLIVPEHVLVSLRVPSCRSATEMIA